MALDGMFLHHIKNEIETHALNSRVDKIYQPNKEEIVLSLRNKDGLHKLLISARANSPRIHFQKHQIENPQTPPMFCMLLRKKLSSAKLIKILQTDLERVLFLNFECINELGDHENLSLVVEIMGKYSNIILLNENGTIVDSLKRVNAEMSSKRLILPGIKYQLPPSQDKFCLLNENIDKILDKITNQPKTEHLNKTLLKTLQGVSPIICREIEFYVGNGMTVVNDEITHDEKTKLRTALKSLKDTVSNFDGNPYMISDQSDSPFDVTFIKPKQYADSALIKKFESFSELLDDFYFEKDVKERMRSKSQDLLKKLNNLNERLSKKINLQKKELLSCSDREKFRVWADVINANIYSIEKGSTEVELQNFYDENQNFIKIKLDPSLSAARNAQKY